MTSDILASKESVLLAEMAARKLTFYRPYPKQIKFHNASADYREILLMAANQVGKTYCAAAQTAMHATGKYFDWYEGRRFKKAPVIWCAGKTGAVVRDTIQKLLIGDLANPGTGLLPHGSYETTPSRGVADLMDTILVKHASGGNTRITLKMYEQGREKFQADTVDFVWLDEEPDEDIYLEALTRTNATGGYLIMTFTPLKGQSKVVKRFTRESSPDRRVIGMTIEDAEHIAVEKRQQIINSYAKHEQEARIYGKPIPGTGLIFPITREEISCDPFDMASVPFYWLELAGMDFAGSGADSHPTAAVRLLYNPQDDIIYVTNTYRRKGGTPMVHAAALRSWGKVPFAWPHDGLQHDKGSGAPLKDLYRNEGLNMLPGNARFEDGGNGVEAGIALMLMRMESGRLKIFSHLNDLFEEIGSYYRDEGKIIKVDEDCICACLHPDTGIITDKGICRIADLAGTAGRALTINGEWADYRNCRMTRAAADLMEVVYSDGHTLLCTPDHELLSTDGLWIKAVDSMGMECHNAISYRAKTKWKILNTAKQYIRSIPKIPTAITLAKGKDICIGLSTKKTLGKFLKITISIISTVSEPITFFLICLPCRARSIWHCIIKDTGVILMPDWRRSGNFTKRSAVRNSPLKWAGATIISCALSVNFFVSAAAIPLQRRIQEAIGFVLMPASPNGAGMRGWTMPKDNAPSAQKYSGSINIKKLFTALKAAAGNTGLQRRKATPILSVSAVQTAKFRSDVYCMEIPATGAFALANGAIVHNCRYAIMDLRFAVRVKAPRGTINGYSIEDAIPKDSYLDPNYNPLGRDYISKLLTGQT